MARYVRQAGCAAPHGRGNRSGTGWRSKTLSGLFGPAFTGRLSWGFQRSPLHRHGLLASTPALVPGWWLATSLPALRPDPARGQVLFRLHGFSPSWWFAPRAVLRVCCTPLPILGFAEFRAALPVPRGSGRFAVLVGASALRSFSLASSRPSCEGSCLPAVRRSEIRSVRLQGLAPLIKSAASESVATGCRSLLPWAFLPQDEEKGFTFSANLRRSLIAAVPWGSSFPTYHLALELLAESRAFGFGPCGFRPWPGRWFGYRFLLPRQREARGAVGPFRPRFRSVPDASIRSRLESARGVGPHLSLVAMTPAARDFDESLEI